MNEQLRKAIEEATRVETQWTVGLTGDGMTFDLEYLRPSTHKISQTKLLRVIEVLVQQRDHALLSFINVREIYDAELIAALEGDG